MADQRPFERQWQLFRILSTRRLGATIRELAGELCTTDKTIRRDLDLFRTMNIPLEVTEEARGRKRFRIAEVKASAGREFTFEEAAALALAEGLLASLAGTSLGLAAQRAVQKVRQSLDEKALKYLSKLAECVRTLPAAAGRYEAKSEFLDAITDCLEDRRMLFITYQSARATEPVSYEVYPYALVLRQGSLYLVAYAPHHGEVRHYKVDRIEAADRTEMPFDTDHDFDLTQHLGGSFGIYHGRDPVRVTVRFSAEVARYVSEKHWHASQRLAAQSDGSLVATFALSTTVEIKQWIQSFGRHAIVESPPSLAEEIYAESQELCAEYAERRVKRRRENE